MVSTASSDSAAIFLPPGGGGDGGPSAPGQERFATEYSGAQRGHGSSRRRMSTSVKANRMAVLSLGEQLRNILHEENRLIKDRKYHLRTYKASLVGTEMVDWLIERGEVSSREEGVDVMQKLLEYGIIHHVVDDHNFKDEKLFYRFRRDDGTYQGPADPPIVARGQRIYSRVKSVPGFIADRKYHLQSYRKCFVGHELVQWLLTRGECASREEAEQLGRQLLEAGVIKHVCNDHHFKDGYLFYRFVNDETSPRSLKDRLGLQSSRKDASLPSHHHGDHQDGEVYQEIVTEESTKEEDCYQSMSSVVSSEVREFTEDAYVQMSRTSASQGEDTTCKGQDGWNRSGSVHSNSSQASSLLSWDELLAEGAPYVQKDIAVTSDAVGFGFIIRGHGPVFVHTVDQHGPAAAVGMTVGEYVLEVNGVNVKTATHKDVAQIILQGSSTARLKTLWLPPSS